MYKILSVFGTRPEAIKMAVLVRKLNAHPLFDHRLCVTGQHRQLLDQVLGIFQIVPDFDMNIMQPGQDLSDITSRVLLKIREVLKEFQPDLVLVHGDTTTCFATTLGCFYAGIKVGHVEAGLRTGNLQAPFPEEANRVMVSRLASYHFAPTPRNVETLLNEGVAPQTIVQTGNTVLDALLHVAGQTEKLSEQWRGSALENSILKKGKTLLVTGHRRENFGQGFVEICRALAVVAAKYPELDIIYPVHLNLPYEDFIFVMKNAYLVLTDSGGVQEEAPGLGKPVLVMRETTERPEAVEAGTVKLVGANAEKIIAGVSELMENPAVYQQMSKAYNPYGDGKATDRIVSFLEGLAQSN
jgi:UDP-N-acetylglucosamine 2-epimerase (non-hydrolysing)